jgi:hypothetical protein
MNNVKRLVRTTENTVIDMQTGQALQTETTNVYSFGAEPPYVKMYLDDLCSFVELPESPKKLLLMMLRRVDYQGYVILSARARREMAASLGWGDGAFRNKLGDLCKKELLIRCSTNEYAVNPNYFARGDWKTICEQRKEFQMLITYGPEGRTVQTSAVPSQEELDL